MAKAIDADGWDAQIPARRCQPAIDDIPQLVAAVILSDPSVQILDPLVKMDDHPLGPGRKQHFAGVGQAAAIRGLFCIRAQAIALAPQRKHLAGPPADPRGNLQIAGNPRAKSIIALAKIIDKPPQIHGPD